MTKAQLPPVTVVGAGLAGAEAAWQLANAQIPVELIDMKPQQLTEAHTQPTFAELVCSNSLRAQDPHNAVGLLKQEMLALNSLIMQTALRTAVPAGSALAVDRQRFSALITEQLLSHPLITYKSALYQSLPLNEPQRPVLIATGPLTAKPLLDDIARLTGAEDLYFYDALAPIIAAESIDHQQVFRASRYGEQEGDYLNCPLSKEAYENFVAALTTALYVEPHAFEERYFAGCQPIEVIAQSGPQSLRFGPLKPVGLQLAYKAWRPAATEKLYAVVQLRQEDLARTAYNLVGFQTKLKISEQQRIFRTLPGLAAAEFWRYGSLHRNSYLHSPRLLDPYMRLKSHPHIRFIGQITGVEGYVESAAHGLLTAKLLSVELLTGKAAPLPPLSCALGALYGHVLNRLKEKPELYEPHNINWSLFAPLTENIASEQILDKSLITPNSLSKKKYAKALHKELRLQQAQLAFREWLKEMPS